MASAELHSYSVKRGVGLSLSTCFIKVILFPQPHPAVIPSSCSGIRLPMARGCLGACEVKPGGRGETRQQLGKRSQSLDQAWGPGAGKWPISHGRPLGGSGLQTVLSASPNHSLHSFSFLSPVDGIRLFLILQLLKCMTNT